MSSIWAGDFGNEYTRRNSIVSSVDVRAAVWASIVPPDTKSILEVGANTGQNLEAIASFAPDINLSATEPNRFAREELVESGITPRVTSDFADKLSFPDDAVDLAFTSGVLIHISADQLLPSMKEIHRVARRYIICAEYFAPSEEMVPYRGRADALWRRDYGSLWLDNFPDLLCTMNFFAWKRATGLDNLMFWRFEKGHRRH